MHFRPAQAAPATSAARDLAVALLIGRKRPLEEAREAGSRGKSASPREQLTVAVSSSSTVLSRKLAPNLLR